MWEFGRASDPEGLRLMVAFFRIMNPARRVELIRLAEQFAGEAIERPSSLHDFSQDNESGE